ncbi:MAG: zinc protease [Cyclobacteriaceae bacterium]|jgi:zinc protease
MIDRSVVPVSDKISKPTFPEAEIIRISSEIDLIMLSQHDQPVIMFDCVIPIGRGHEITPGISYLVAKMLHEGTTSKTNSDIANSLDYHGSHLEITPTLDHVFIRLYCLKKFFENQVSLLFEMIGHSVFQKKEFEKQKTIRKQDIKQMHAKTNGYAGLNFRKSIFGEFHPYGQIIQVEDVKNTSLDQVKDFYANSFKMNPTFFLAGAADTAEINILKEKLAEITFGASPKLIDCGIAAGGNIHLNWENSVQSSLRLGAPSISKSHPDIHKLKIANELLGGFFGSRLMKNIREEKGLTYGISSSLVHLKEGSYWVIGTDVLKEKVDLAISEIKKEIISLHTSLPTTEEVNTLKSYLKGKWLMSFDSCFNSMHLITNNHLAGLTNQHWIDFMDAVDKSSPEEISETVQKYYNTNEICEVIVG